MTTKKFEGYHDDHELPIKRGQLVTIPKGTAIHTTMPQPGDKNKVAGRTYKVKVSHTLPGRNRRDEQGNWDPSYPVENPKVCWPGTGGYWHEVDINDVPEAQVANETERA